MPDTMTAALRDIGLIVAVALVAMAVVFFIGALQSSKTGRRLVERWRHRREFRRAEKERKRCREVHAAEIAAWEAFFEAAHYAIHCPLEIRDERLSPDSDWQSYFREHLERARTLAQALPEPHRSPALRRLSAIDQAVEDQGLTVALYPRSSRFLDAVGDLRDWMSENRIRYFLKLYSRCGLNEPSWTHRIKSPLKEQFEITATPPPAPPASKASE